ncbi:MAG: replicative DNA helicase [Solirubrobacterales bacterium]
MSANGQLPEPEPSMATAQKTHVPPQNLEAEESVLGAMMVASAAIDPVMVEVRLRVEDFYREQHRQIFAAIQRLEVGGDPVDALTVSEALSQAGELEAAGGRDAISSLAATAPAPGNARHYAEIVQQNALLRRLIGAAQTIQQSVSERHDEPKQLAERAEALLFKVAHEEQASDFRTIGEVLDDELEKLEKLSKGGGGLIGTPSGFRDIDEITGGFQDGNLIVLAARPSMGKSTLVCNIAENAAVKEGRPVALFSLEMSEAELAQRFIASQARINGDKLRKGQVAKRDWPAVVRACNELDKAPLWIDDSADLGMLELRAKARRLHAQERSRGGLSLVIVDYLQLMRAEDPRQNRVEQVGQMSRGLKILSQELMIPVIGVSQLSRAPEQRPGGKPMLSDLRESGQIEQDADLVMFIWREDRYKEDSERRGEADIIIAKHRNGPVGEKTLVFLPHYPKFADMAHGERPVEQRAGGAPGLIEGESSSNSSGDDDGFGIAEEF